MDYVECIFGNEIRVQCETRNLVNALALLNGFVEVSRNGFTVSYSNEIELAFQLSKLNDLGFLFVNAGPDMHPGGMYQLLREKGLVNERIKTISWSAPNCPVFGSA